MKNLHSFSRFVSVATGPDVSGDYFMGRGEAYSHKRDAGASGDRPDGEMGVRKAEAEEMDNGQLGMRVLRRAALAQDDR